MKIKQTTSMLAMAALLAGAGAAFAGDSSTFDASVSVLSPDQTGFIIGGQVAVNGLGSGALTLSRSNAQMSVTGGAKSVLDPVAVGSPYLSGVTSDSNILSALDFSRDISTSGSLVGQGSVVSTGQAIASMGTAGAASANTTTAGVRADSGTLGSTPYTPGGEGSASATSSTQGSLNGSVSTSNSLQLLGTSGLFAGSNSLTVGEENQAIASGAANIVADGKTGIDLTGASPAYVSGALPTAGTGDGAAFGVKSTLNGTGNKIALSVSNAGNGTISLTTSTGGFFTGGGAAGGSATHIDSKSFFSPTTITP